MSATAAAPPANPDDVHRTVLILGKTGNGKSTLANVLVGAHLLTPPEEIFKEGQFGASETAESQEHVVDVSGSKYRVVDTIGVGDTGLGEEQVMLNLARTCHYLRGGINQILFVSSGKFTKEERDVFHMLRHVLFDDNVERFVTMVRTKAPFFTNADKCKQDVAAIKKTNADARAVLDNIPKVLHVSNPTEDETQDWQTLRQRSRCILLAWLERCDNRYYPESLEKIQKRVKEHVEEAERLAKKMEALEKAVAESAKENKALIKELKETKEKHSQEIKKTADAMKEQCNENYAESIRQLNTEIASLKSENERQRSREGRVLWGLVSWKKTW